MKTAKKMFILTLCFTVVLIGCARAAEKRYKVKSGYVKYRLSGQNSGIEELYFDDWGNKEARYLETTVSIFGFKQTSKAINIIDGDWSYNVDLDEKTAMRVNIKERTKEMKQMMGDQGGFLGHSEKELKSMGRKKVGTEKILGKTCTIWEMKDFGSKLWEWKGVPLKTETEMMGISVLMEAVEFKDNAKIDQAKFKIPAGIQLNDAPEMNMSPEEAARMQEGMKKMRAFRKSGDYEMRSDEMQDMQDPQDGNMEAEQMQDSKSDTMKKAVGGLLKEFFN